MHACIYIYIYMIDILSDDRLDKPLSPSEISQEEYKKQKTKTNERNIEKKENVKTSAKEVFFFVHMCFSFRGKHIC